MHSYCWHQQAISGSLFVLSCCVLSFTRWRYVGFLGLFSQKTQVIQLKYPGAESIILSLLHANAVWTQQLLNCISWLTKTNSLFYVFLSCLTQYIGWMCVNKLGIIIKRCNNALNSWQTLLRNEILFLPESGWFLTGYLLYRMTCCLHVMMLNQSQSLNQFKGFFLSFTT